MHPLKLSIIIVNWNTVDLLKQTLGSVLKEKLALTCEVIVVDNNSADGSPDMVEGEFPEVHLVKNNQNVGFSKANNQAMKIASGEYILLLNSDTIVADNRIFAEWISFMDANPAAGASGCKLVYPDGAHQVGDGGYRPCFRSVFNHFLFLSVLFPGHFRGLYLPELGSREAVEVDWICGADLLVRRSILEKVGLMDEENFMYAEDIEWGCRVRRYGYKIYYLPGMSIVHLQAASTKKLGNYSYLWLDNSRNVYANLNRNQSIVCYDIILILGFFLRWIAYYLIYLKTGSQKTKEKSHLMYLFMGHMKSKLFD